MIEPEEGTEADEGRSEPVLLEVEGERACGGVWWVGGWVGWVEEKQAVRMLK